MQKKRQSSPGYIRCYKQAGNPLLVWTGILLAGIGVVLLFLCIPGWAWVAMLGFALISGVVFLRLHMSREPREHTQVLLAGKEVL